jgi:hypothetical protein
MLHLARGGRLHAICRARAGTSFAAFARTMPNQPDEHERWRQKILAALSELRGERLPREDGPVRLPVKTVLL